LEGEVVMIQTRLAQLSDAPELKKLNDLVNGEGSNTVDAIKNSLEANNQEIICVAAEISENTNKLIGFCSGQIIKSMCYSIYYGDIIEFFVIEEYRCADISKQLVNQMEMEFNKRGITHLHHFTGKENSTAQELFHSLGYVDSSASCYNSSSITIFSKDTV
jgi:ribosomal protein S18 acetylase RimI-like enzyme